MFIIINFTLYKAKPLDNKLSGADPEFLDRGFKFAKGVGGGGGRFVNFT